MNTRKHPELYKQKEIWFLCCDSDRQLAHFLKISTTVNTPAHIFCRSWTQCSYKRKQIFNSHFKEELSISWPTNKSGVDSGHISAWHFPSNYYQIPMEGLHKLFLSERNLIVHSFMAAAVFWKIDVSGLKFFFISYVCNSVIPLATDATIPVCTFDKTWSWHAEQYQKGL